MIFWGWLLGASLRADGCARFLSFDRIQLIETESADKARAFLKSHHDSALIGGTFSDKDLSGRGYTAVDNAYVNRAAELLTCWMEAQRRFGPSGDVEAVEREFLDHARLRRQNYADRELVPGLMAMYREVRQKLHLLHPSRREVVERELLVVWQNEGAMAKIKGLRARAQKGRQSLILLVPPARIAHLEALLQTNKN